MTAVLPRTTVRTIDAPPVLAADLDSTRLFIAAESYRGGTTDPIRFTGPRDLERHLERTGVGIPAYDAIDVALREGVPEVYLSRIVGDAAASAALNLDGTAAGTPYSLTLTANEPGEWANGATEGLSAAVTSPGGGSTRQITVYRDAVAWISSPIFSVRADALAWNALQDHVTVALGGENTLPVVAAAANFTGGDSDSAGITTDSVREALDRIPMDLGSGQVVIPGRSTVESNTELAGHCDEFNRTGLGEIADGLDVADVAEVAVDLRALGSGAEGVPRLLGMWAQHAVAPGLVPGTTRTVPFTIVVAGLIARLEHSEGHPNVAPFGDYGVPQYITGVTRYFTAADAATLFDSGVNIVERLFDFPRNASFRSLETEGESEWIDLAHTRFDRAIRADAYDVGRNMGARVINRQTLQDFGLRLRARLEAYWKRGASYGDTADEASRVDVDAVNDLESMAAREVNAAIGVRMSEHAEQVAIDIAKIPISQAV